MKYLLIVVLYIIVSAKVLGAQTPNIDFSIYSGVFPAGGIIDGIGIFPPWKISHGSPDIYRDLDNKVIVSCAATPFNDACVNATATPPNCNCPEPNACEEFFPVIEPRIKDSEGFYYPFNFKRGHKYTISFKFNIGSNQTNGSVGSDVMDKIFVVPTSGLPDINSSLAPNRCQSRCYWPPQWPYDVPNHWVAPRDFKPRGQGWFQSSVRANAPTSGVGSSFQSVTFCFYAEQDYTQLWFSCNDLTRNPSSTVGTVDPLSFNVKDIRIEGECIPTYVYEGGEYRYMSDPGFSTIFPMPVPLATTGVSDNIILQPNRGTVYIASSTASNAGVSLTAGNYIDFKAPISPAANKYIEINYFSNQPSTTNPYEPYAGRTPYYRDIGIVGGFEAKIEPCNGFDAPNACQEYQQWPNQAATPNGSADGYAHNVDLCAGNSSQQIPGLSLWRPIFRNYRKPYNAYAVEWHVFDRWGGEVCGGKYRDECNGVPDGTIKCTGCEMGRALNTGVYIYVIHLTNCHGMITLRGDFTFLNDFNGCHDPCQIKVLEDIPKSNLEDTEVLPQNANPVTELKEMLLFPNPADDQLTIVFPVETELESIKHIQVMDVSGSVVKDMQAQGSSSSIERIDISGLTAGSYFIRVQSDVKILSQKFIKL